MFGQVFFNYRLIFFVKNGENSENAEPLNLVLNEWIIGIILPFIGHRHQPLRISVPADRNRFFFTSNDESDKSTSAKAPLTIHLLAQKLTKS